MRRMRLFCGIALAAMLPAPAVIADMDYRCLNMCVSGGKASSACMDQCSYGQKPAASHGPSLLTPVRSPHDQFTPPVPTGQVILHPQGEHTQSGKDYTCVSKCQQDQHPYQFCEEQCADVTTPAAEINAGGNATTTANPSSLLNARQPQSFNAR